MGRGISSADADNNYFNAKLIKQDKRRYEQSLLKLKQSQPDDSILVEMETLRLACAIILLTLYLNLYLDQEAECCPVRKEISNKEHNNHCMKWMCKKFKCVLITFMKVKIIDVLKAKRANQERWLHKNIYTRNRRDTKLQTGSYTAVYVCIFFSTLYWPE